MRWKRFFECLVETLGVSYYPVMPMGILTVLRVIRCVLKTVGNDRKKWIQERTVFFIRSNERFKKLNVKASAVLGTFANNEC